MYIVGFFEKNGEIYNNQELVFDNINNIINLAKNKNKKIFFVGNGSIAHRDVIESKIIEAEILLDDEKNKLNARNIAKAAYVKRDEAVDTNNLKPIYLRQSSAERLMKKE